MNKYLQATMFCGLLLVLGLSALGHSVPIVSAVITISTSLAVLYFGYSRVQLGVLLILIELSIGSFGHLFSISFFNYAVSFRQALFIGLLLGWLVRKASRHERIDWFPKSISGPLRLLWLSVAISMLVGLGRFGLSATIGDANGYWFLLLAPVFFDAFKASDWTKVGQYLASAQGVLTLVTVALLIAFAWLPENVVRGIYTWVRDVRLAEITPVAGTYFRIFFQSHFYSLVIALGALTVVVTSGSWSRRWASIIAAAAGLAVVASLSRSLWAGALVGLMTLFVGLKKYQNWTGMKLVKLGGVVVLVVLVEVLFLQVVTGNFLPGNLQRRFDLTEPAAAERVAQLQPLWKAIGEHPVWGSGFGRQLTYQASDPRRLQESATVSTMSFELGWLDTWLDIGLVGALALLWWLWRLWRAGIALASQSWVGLATLTITLAIAAVHLFTPYLNHPLGLGALMAISSLLPRINTRYA